MKFTRYKYKYNYNLFVWKIFYVTYLTLYILVTSLYTGGFKIQKLYILFLEFIFFVLYGYQNKQRLCYYTGINDYFYIREAVCLLHGTNCFLG